MKPDPIELPRPSQATDEESRERDNACLEIELDGRAGLGRLFDARLFQPARREYARRLLEALCEHPGVRKAEVELASSTCRVEFDLDSNTRAVMGGSLASASYRLGTRRQDSMVEAKPALVDPHRLSVVRRPLTLGNVRGRAGECTACPSGACARPRRCLPSGRQPGGPRRGRAMPRVAMVASDYDRLRSGCWLIGRSHGGPRGANPGGAEGCRSEGSRLEVGRCA